MNTNPGNIIPDAPQSEVNTGLVQLHESCASLEKTVGILIHSLTPVLSPDSPKSASGGQAAPESPAVCPVRQKLDNSIDGIRHTESQLNILISRLAV